MRKNKITVSTIDKFVESYNKLFNDELELVAVTKKDSKNGTLLLRDKKGVVLRLGAPVDGDGESEVHLIYNPCKFEELVQEQLDGLGWSITWDRSRNQLDLYLIKPNDDGSVKIISESSNKMWKCLVHSVIDLVESIEEQSKVVS